MRPTTRAGSLWFICLLLALAPASAVDASGNLLRNPGFEFSLLDQDDGLPALHGSLQEPAYWWPGQGDPGQCAMFLWDTTVQPKAGERTVSVSTELQNPSCNHYNAWNSYVACDAFAGSSVTLRAYAYLEPHEEAAVEFRIHAFRDGVAVGAPCGGASAPLHEASDWVEHALSFRVPPEATHLMVQLGIQGTGSAWFDEAMLVVDEDAGVATETWSEETADPRCIHVMEVAEVDRGTFSSPTVPCPEKEWNILMYAAADFWNGYAPMEDFAADVQGNAAVNVLVLEDPYGTGASIWHVQRAGYQVELTPLHRLGEPDMADGETLERFLAFANAWYPAKRTLLLLYGHGHAWWGTCNDDSNGSMVAGTAVRDWLSPPELAAALEFAGGIDALMFSAPCNASSLEAAYEVRSHTDLFVASEEGSGYTLWRDAVGPIAYLVSNSPDVSPRALAEEAVAAIREGVQKMIDAGSPYVEHQWSIAATLTGQLTNVGFALDAFSLALLAALPEQMSAISAARARTEQFRSGELVDIQHFARQCLGIPEVADRAAELIDTLKRAIVARIANPVDHPESGGLSLYFPVYQEEASENGAVCDYGNAGHVYCNYGLDLIEATHWHAFLESYFGQMDP